MIVFRQVDQQFWDKGSNWYVEYFDDDPDQMTFPVGTAYVTAIPDGSAAQVNFVLVADQWRRTGIASALIKACRDRWPKLAMTPGMDTAGKALYRELIGPDGLVRRSEPGSETV